MTKVGPFLDAVYALFVLAADIVELVDRFAAASCRHCAVTQHQAMTSVVPLLALVEAGVVVLRDGEQVDVAPLLLHAYQSVSLEAAQKAADI